MNSRRPGLARRLLDRIPGSAIQIGQVFSGMLGRNLLRGLFKLLLPAFLAKEAYGVLRAIVSFWRILCSLTDIGFSNAVTVFVPSALKRKDHEERDRTLMTTLMLFAGAISVITIGGLLLAEPLARWTLGDPGLAGYARLAFLAVGGRLVWKFQESNFAAHQQFGRLAVFLMTIPALMLTVGVVLALTGRLTLTAAILIQLFAPTATILIWWPAFHGRFLRLGNWDGALARRIFGFGRWIYLSGIASSLRSHLNPLLLKSPHLSGSVAVGEASAGIYGFGSDLAGELQMLSGSIVTVLVPKASRKSRPDQFRRYVVRAYGFTALLLLPLALLPLLAEPGLHLLGRISKGYLDFLPSLSVFYILYGGGLLSIATLPVQAVLYAMQLPQIETRVEAVNLPILVIGSILLIPRYGPAGAASAVLMQRIVTFFALVTYGIYRLWLRRDEREPARDGDGDRP